MRRLPFRKPRRYGGTLGTPRGSQLAYAGAQGVFRDDDNSANG